MDIKNTSVAKSPLGDSPLGGRGLWLRFLSVFLFACTYYSFAVRANGTKFDWGYDLGGYYDQLGRAFARGQLHLEAVPKPELLALPNPYDWRNESNLRLHDMVLYQERYYLYHGAVPALLLFAPFRMLTGYDLPENFALLLFALGTYSFYVLAFVTCARHAMLPRISGTTLWIGLALAFANTFPLLTRRVWVYEIAIAAGAFLLAAGIFCLSRILVAKAANPLPWALAAGFAFGAAIGCRPHLGIAGAVACLFLWRLTGFRVAMAFALPFTLCGIGVGAYNYLRFGNFFEFGVKYLLTGGPNQNLHFSLHFLPLALFFFIFHPPELLHAMPWISAERRLALGNWQLPYPPDIFVEGTVGALFVSPLILAAAWPPVEALKIFHRVLLTISLSILFLVCITGFVTQRYLVDFVPPLVFAALLSLAHRPAARFLLPLLVLSSIFVNLFLRMSF